MKCCNHECGQGRRCSDHAIGRIRDALAAVGVLAMIIFIAFSAGYKS